MNRFFVEPSDIDGKYIYVTDKGDLHHMNKVLRLSRGDEAELSDGNSWEYKARLEEPGDEKAVFLILDKQKFAREPRTRVTLYQGIPKGSKMEEIIQKSVELGVHSIVPVFMERTVVVDRGNFGKKLTRWQKISDEAVKQCRRGMIPIIEEPVKFDGLIELLDDYDMVLFPYENEEDRTIKDALREAVKERDGSNTEEKGKPLTVAVIIGPEGGFSRKEADMLTDKKVCKVSLGKTILRTETAGPASLAMIMYELEL